MKSLILILYVVSICVNICAGETTVDVDTSCVNETCSTESSDLALPDTKPTVILNSESSSDDDIGLTTDKAPTASPVRQNSSSIPTANGTMLTTPSPTTVTTVLTTTDSTVPQQVQNKTKEPCTCDQIDGECEVNCCCDPDCDSSDLNVFSFCRSDKPSPPSDFCLTTDIIYRNTTVYTLTQSENRLFCVDTHNIPNSLKFSNQKIVGTEDGFHKLLKHKKLFKWNLQESERYSFSTIETKPYKFGLPLIFYNNESSDFPFSNIVLYGEGTTSICSGVDRIKYLKNDQSSCLLKLPLNKDECEGNPLFSPSTYCLHQLISSPDLYNKTIDNLENITLSFSLYLCQDNCNKVTELPDTKFDEENSKCHYVTKSVKYLFKHNGTKGIVNASCYVETTSLPVRRDFTRIFFGVHYEWAKEVKDSFPRSGRPGYLSGKPLISGMKTDKKDLRGRDIFTFSKSPNDWIQILWTSNGTCSVERKHILIGENVKSQCLIKVPLNETKTQKGCVSLHNEVLRYLLGTNNASKEIWLSSWGDPDQTSWAPLIFAPPPPQAVFSNKCLAVASSLHIRIVTAYVGPVYAPQMKLVGAKGDIRNSPLLCDAKSCTVIAVTTVTFTDSTSSPVATFAKPPIIRFHLPHDFFYPFSIGSSATGTYCGITTLLNALCILYLLKYC